MTGNKRNGREFPTHRKKHITTITLDEDERGLLNILAEQNGLNRTDVVRMAIRRLAKELGAQP
jgi:hypothetical protein